jgi:hypothetical protein
MHQNYSFQYNWRERSMKTCAKDKSLPQICYASGPSWTRATIVLARFARRCLLHTTARIRSWWLLTTVRVRFWFNKTSWSALSNIEPVYSDQVAGILWSGWQLTMRARRRPPSVPAWRKAIKNKTQIILQWKFLFLRKVAVIILNYET